jgi:flagellar assembly protein FliH
MTTTPLRTRPGEPPASSSKSAPGRFIPREELPPCTVWQPGHLSEPSAAKRASAQAQEAALAAARQAGQKEGYQDGYRDGMAALAGFKESFVQQAQAQIGALLEAFDKDMASMEQAMATSLTRLATRLAQHVVRAEIHTRPELVAQVAREAVDALLASAKQVIIHVHPDDLALVEQDAGEVIRARGARLVGEASIERGGVKISSDAGSVDATLNVRWQEATHPLVCAPAWPAHDIHVDHAEEPAATQTTQTTP